MRTVPSLQAGLVILLSFTAGPRHAMAAADYHAEARRQALLERGKIRTWPKRPWRAAYQIRTRNYTIRTNTSHDVAQYIGDVMEMTANHYRTVFGCRNARIPGLVINAYATRAEYELVAQKAGFPAGVTGGFYSPQDDGAIHIPFQIIHGVHPSVTLYHEGTHQFVHQVIDYRVPFTLKPQIPKDKHILISTPIWLNEGLATYMETLYYDGNKLEIGRINQGRLFHLQKMLRAKTNPSVAEVLARRYGQPFGVEHYAMAWGLVYALRHHSDKAKQKANRAKLIQYIEACKKGFYFNPRAQFVQEFLKGGKLPDDFDIRWNVRLGEQSKAAFVKLIVGPTTTLEKWSAAWATRILSLDVHQPYGGWVRDEPTADPGLHR